MFFAELPKYLIYAHPGPFLYQVICTYKSNIQFMRKPLPDRRLACPHKTCKDDVLHITTGKRNKERVSLYPISCFLFSFSKIFSNSPNTLYNFSLSHQENHRQIFLKRHWLSQGQPQTRRSQRQQAQRIYLTFPHLPEKTSWYLYPLTLTAYKASVSVSSQPLTGLVSRYSYRLQSRLHYLSSGKISVPAASFPAPCPLSLAPVYRRFHHAPLSQTYRPLQTPYPPQLL